MSRVAHYVGAQSVLIFVIPIIGGSIAIAFAPLSRPSKIGAFIAVLPLLFVQLLAVIFVLVLAGRLSA